MLEGPASLHLSLSELRSGPVDWKRTLESPHVAMPGLPKQLQGPLTVRVRATLGEDGGIRVTGEVSGSAVLECRRCLTPVRCEIESTLEAWFRRDDLAGPEERGVWAFDPDASEIDLREALREELWLAVPEFALCRSDCPGLCARCGAQLESEECRCPPQAPDPRWGALEAARGSLASRAGKAPDSD
jgi:uncharacterized protein